MFFSRHFLATQTGQSLSSIIIMFQACIQDGILFKKIVDAIQSLVKSVNLDANGTGISIQAMDTSHVALIALNLNEKGFKSFRCDKSITMGLQIENLQKILRCLSNDDILTLSTKDDDPQTLQFKFESKKGDRLSEFKLNLMSLDSEQLGVPDTEYSSVIKMPSAEFTKVCRELGSISDAIGIETSKESIKFHVKGEVGEGQITYRQNSAEKPEDSIECSVDEPVNMNFALRYLNLFNKASQLSSQVTLNMTQDQPLVVDYEIDGAQQSLGNIRLYLAPKINDEEQQ